MGESMTAGRSDRRPLRIRRRGRHTTPSQVEKVAQQAGKAAPAVAIAGALVASPQASHALAASAKPVTATAQSHTTAAADKAASTGAHTGTASLDSFETRTVTVAAAKPARHAAAAAHSTYYSVRSGDTLSNIANSYYHSADDWQYLYHENDKALSDPNLIYVGQRLLIPATAPAHYTLSDYVPKHAMPAQPAASTVSQTSQDSDSQPSAAPATIAGDGGGGNVVTQSAAQGMFSCSSLEQLWNQEGGSPAAALMAADIAMAESGGNPNAISPTNDFGLWQINGSNGSLATLNPFQNAKSAIDLSGNGTNWGPWTTYTSGAYSGKC
ncbi:MAG: LysM peptidoglycan-binding protein [Actinomycetia bacterium]|nr:LysM peptidoglycan-binding protein [Actinomycetes bacterium]